MAIGPLPLVQRATFLARILVRLDPGGSHRRPAPALQCPGALRPQVGIWKSMDLGLAPEPSELAEPPNHEHRV
eukprot:6202858-Alexandrium_andersonii.AAC.1